MARSFIGFGQLSISDKTGTSSAQPPRARRREVGEAVGLNQKEVSQATEVYQTDSCPKGIKLAVAATYTDADWKPPRSATMRKTPDGPETGSDTTTEIVSRHGREAR